MICSKQDTLQEPVEIRAHHLFSFADFTLYRPSVEASLARWYQLGKDPEIGNFNGYGREFVEHEAETWDYIVKHPRTTVKITDQYDSLCVKCGNWDGCSDGADAGLDEISAPMLKVEIGKIYTAQELVAIIRDLPSMRPLLYGRK
ncbi:MAG: DUF1284 domain-containing protein [Candidatus Aenigmatarchaeota archaeon]